jgi:AcrR family transcriptional regulator
MTGGDIAAPRYHHGNLRNALVDAGLAMLERDGLSALSLRALAASVGVSHAAPAHHFGTLEGLRTALATVGFTRFETVLREAGVAEPTDPMAHMRAAEQAYLGFARAHPTLFRLMFSAGLLDWTDTALQQSAGEARKRLSELCSPAAAYRGLDDPAARLALEHLVWSTVHGRAHLAIDGKVDTDPNESDALRTAGCDLAALLFAPPAGPR